jgi:hypothetical protein
MKLSVNNLQKEEELIAEDIDMFCQDMISDKAKPVYDGVVNVEKYVNGEKYRICWVLKELYDKEGGDWYLCDFLSDETRWREIAKHPVWKRGIYTTYGIINNFIDYSEMDYICDDPEMVQCLSHIAVINVNKTPASTTSSDANIARKYKHFKPVLLRQLKQYDPQIIIFGKTFQHFQNDLGIKDEELTNYYKDKKKPRYIVKNGKLYVDAYHPAVRQSTMTEADYVQSIIDIVEMNKENIE